MSNVNEWRLASAFPTPREVDEDGVLRAHSQPGLSKREYIATQAMNGLMATIQPGDAKITHEKLAALVAPVCVAFADALLAELAKAQP